MFSAGVKARAGLSARRTLETPEIVGGEGRRCWSYRGRVSRRIGAAAAGDDDGDATAEPLCGRNCREGRVGEVLDASRRFLGERAKVGEFMRGLPCRCGRRQGGWRQNETNECTTSTF